MTAPVEPTSPTHWRDLLARWDAQQAVYIEHRERRYDVMFEFIAALGPERPTVLDLACGPGSLAARVLQRLAGSTVVAVDADPVLLHIGKGALGDAGGRLRWLRADLRDPGWAATLEDESFDVAVSSTALHWLHGADLVAVYERIGELLGPDGVVLNADYLPLRNSVPGIAATARTIDGQRQARAISAGADSWDQWWEQLRTDPALAAHFAERDRVFPPGAPRRAPASLALHEAGLAAAGFDECAVVWQDLEERLLVATRGHREVDAP